MRWLFDLSIRNKILCLTILLLIMMVMVGGVTVKNSFALREVTNGQYSKDVPWIGHMQAANVALLRVEQTASNILLAHLDSTLDADLYQQKMKAELHSVHKEFNDAEAYFDSVAEKGAFINVQQAFLAFEQKLEETLVLAVNESKNNMSLEQRVAIGQMLKVARPLAQKTDALIKTAIIEKENASQQIYERASQRDADGQKLLLSIMGMSCFLAIVIGYLLTHRKENTEQAQHESSEVLGEIVRVMEQLNNGQCDARVKLDTKGELQELNTVINTCAENLQTDVWFKTGVVELNTAMLTKETLTEQSKAAINHLARYLQAGMGALYLYDSVSERLSLIAGFACAVSDTQLTEFALGEGVVGQVAAERKAIALVNATGQTIMSGTSQITALNIYTYPLLFKEQLLGVVELATHMPLNVVQCRFLQAAMDQIATSLYASNQTDTSHLLFKRTQYLSSELEQQQIELADKNRQVEQCQRSIGQQEEELAQTHLELSRRKEELQAAQSYKTEFLANLSHELRLPLNNINILSSILKQNRSGNLTDKQSEHAKVIHQAGLDLLQLINDIMDLAKLESKKMTLHVGYCNLSVLLEELQAMFQPIADEKEITLQCVVDGNLPTSIFTDQEKIRQVLKNFLSNALKYTQNGGMITLGITFALPNTPSKLPISIFVKDTGIGISEEKLNTVFQGLQQTDSSISLKFGGIGLGLSISRELTRLLTGEISVTSVVGQGTEFALLLPLALDVSGTNFELIDVLDTEYSENTSQSMEDNKSVALKKSANQETAQHEKLVLIIEEDKSIARLIANEAERLGFKCMFASDGEKGVYLAKHHQPLGIILDRHLPMLKSMDVLKVLKADKNTRHIPVNIISSDEPAAIALNMGAAEFMQEPVTMEDWQRVSAQFFDHSGKQEIPLLLVGNDDKMLQTWNTLLSESSSMIRMTTVTTREEAINAFKSNVFDAAIVDLGLPELSGFNLLEDLKLSYFDLPIIVYAGQNFTQEELKKINQYSKSITLKSLASTEHLLNNIRPFLQRMYQHEDPNISMFITPDLEPSYSFANKKILLVDDDMRNVFTLSGLLEETQAEIISAENGQEALDELQRHPNIDLVLMDIMMPVMDGYEAIKTIRQERSKAQLPIIAVTAKALMDDQQKYLDAGANDYLCNPIHAEQLLPLMKVLMG